MGFLPDNFITGLLDEEDRKRKQFAPTPVLSPQQIQGALGQQFEADVGAGKLPEGASRVDIIPEPEPSQRRKTPLRLRSGRMDPTRGTGARPISLDIIGTNRRDFARRASEILQRANEEPRRGGLTGVARNFDDLEDIAENKAKAARLKELLPVAEAGAINLGLKRQRDLDRLDPSDPVASAYLGIVGEIRQIVGSPSLEGKVSTSERFDSLDRELTPEEQGEEFSAAGTFAKSAAGAIPGIVAAAGGAVPATLFADAIGLGKEAREQIDARDQGFLGRLAQSIAISEEESAQNPTAEFFGRIAGTMPLGLIGPSASTAGLAKTTLGRMTTRGAAVALENSPEVTMRLTLMVESGTLSPEEAAKQFAIETGFAFAAGGALEGITGAFKGKGADEGAKSRVPDGSADDLAESVAARELVDLVRAEDVDAIPNVRLREKVNGEIGPEQLSVPKLEGFDEGMARDVEAARRSGELEEPQIQRIERPGEPIPGTAERPELVQPGVELGQGRRSPEDVIFGTEQRAQIEAERTRTLERQQLDTFLERELREPLGPPEKPKQKMKRSELDESEKFIFDQFEQVRRSERAKKAAAKRKDFTLADLNEMQRPTKKAPKERTLEAALGDAAEARLKRQEEARAPERALDAKAEEARLKRKREAKTQRQKPAKSGQLEMSDAMKGALEDATKAVEGEKLTPEARRAVDKLPPVPEGMTRVWRWEGSGAKRAGGAGGVRGGTWFEESEGVYFNPKRSKPSDGRFLDIPTAEWKRLKSDPNATEVELPAGVAARARAIEVAAPKARKITGAGREVARQDFEAIGLLNKRKAQRPKESEPGPSLTPEQKQIKAEDDFFFEGRTPAKVKSRLSNDAGATEARQRLSREFRLKPGDIVDPPNMKGRRQIVDAYEAKDGKLRVRTRGIDIGKTGRDQIGSKGFEQNIDADIAAKGSADARMAARDRAEATASTGKESKESLRKRLAGDTDAENPERFSDKGEGRILMDVAGGAYKAAAFFARNYGRSMRGVAARVTAKDSSGRSIGRQLSNRINALRNWSEPRIGTAIDAVSRVSKALNDGQYDQMVTWLDGGPRVRDLKVAKAVGVVRRELNKVYESARLIGWDIGEIKNYFPHRFDKVPAELAADGAEALSGVRSRNPFAQLRTRNYNLERSREQSKVGYRRDRNVLNEYFLEGYKQLAEARFFGKRGGDGKFVPRRDQLRGVVDLLNRIPDDGTRETLLEGFTRMTGNEARTAGGRIKRAAADVNALISLSGSAIRQLEQVNQLIGEAGFTPVVKVVGEIIRRPKEWAKFRSEALQSGATVANLRGEIVRAYSGQAGASSRKGLLRGFMWGINTTDGMLRVIANRTARGMLNRFKKSGRTDVLELWGIRNRDITEADYARVGKMLSDKTQFRADVQDLPVGFTSSDGRLVFQFQSFMHRQADWVNQIAIDMVRGNRLVRERAAKRAARFMLSSAITTELFEDFRAWAMNYNVFNEDESKGELSETQVIDAFSRAFASSERVSINTPKLRALQNIMIAGNVGLWWSMADNVIEAGRRGDPIRLLGPVVQRTQRLGRQLAEPDVKGAVAAVTPTLVRRNLERYFGDLFELEPKSKRGTSRRTGRRRLVQ